MAALLYLISFLDNLSVLLYLLLTLFGVTAFFCALMFMESHGKDDFKILKKIFIVIIILAVLKVAIPSERTMYLMLGTKVLSESSIPPKVMDVINKKLEKYLIEEIKGNKTKETE